MKYITTRKAIRANYETIIPVSYCALQNLLASLTPDSYCAGVYGWSCDNYELSKSCVLSTGYNPIGRGLLPYEITSALDKAASMAGKYNPAEIDYLLTDLKRYAEKEITKEELLHYCDYVISRYRTA